MLDAFLDWPFFEERHRALRERLLRFLPDRLADIDDTDDRKASRTFVERLAQDRFLDYAVPQAGERLDVRSLCVIRETLAHHHGLADFAFALQGLGSAPITLEGSRELKERYLPGTREGRFIAAFALSEPHAGSDVSAIATTAKRDGDDFVLDGTKTWISNGGIASYYVVFARSESAPGTKGLSAFVVDAETPGLEVAERIEVVAPHPLAKISFQGCRVPRSRLVGEPGQGFEIAMATLDIFRASVGAAALGFARRALDEALARAESRAQFGKKLGDFQITQAKLADMATAVDASALLVYRAAWMKDRGAERVAKESSMAKLYATEAAQRVVDDAVQIFGAEGVVKGSVPERLYREVRALRIYEGTTEIQKLILARELRKGRSA
ncbi:MAG TPA: acyl-CoA dehydrogenase family protein [Vicinamibacteria bacterium]|nr:acyl-CoA dehydrogenase family protein [Vicinamibacteria bacterium]